MARSMTGFGRAKAHDPNLEFTIEVKTLNHRYLDINLRAPKVINFLEEDIRKLIQGRLNRGRIEVYIQGTPRANDKTEVELNEALAESYMESFRYLIKKYNLKSDISLSDFAGVQDLFLVMDKDQDEESLKKALLSAMDEALEKVVEMRGKEGERLSRDILNRGNSIKEMVETIETRSPTVVEEYKSKLEARIIDLLQSTELDENRFNNEVALFADRCSITEEVVRLKSHLDQLANILLQNESIGRKLDFLVQEMNREANTIGSKANDLDIINLVMDIKSEIEKIREQVQNIE